MTTIYYIAHPQVVIDPDVPVPGWSLSDVGQARLQAVRERPWVEAITTYVSSAEVKAIETAEGLRAGRQDVDIIIREDAHENDRSATGYLPQPRFEELADAFFANPHASTHGWERAIDAQTRIVAMVDDVLATLKPQAPLAFTGHGGVGTLLLCHLLGEPIARIRDQPPGGGNVFAFDSQTRAVHHGWTAIEEIV